MTDAMWIYFMIGIAFGFIARQGYIEWMDHRELMREIERRERLFNVSLEAAMILTAALILNGIANRATREVRKVGKS